MNILITSAGRRSYLIKYFKEALNGKGKVFASNSEYTIALQEADGFFLSPIIYSTDYIPSLIEYCLINDVKAIISVFDIDLLILSKSKDLIESNGIKLFLSPSSVVEICNDKWKTHEFLSENDIKTPKSYKSFSGVFEALKNNQISFPIVIKPRWGMASMGIYIAEDFEELDFYRRRSLRDIVGSYLKFESSLTPNEMLIFQEKLSGQEYGLDIMNDLKGDFICVLPKSKILMRAGETDLGQTVSPIKFEDLARKISNLLRHEVILSVDCFDIDGQLYVLEMNCRISGHYPLSHLAGTNLPKQIVEWLDNKPTDLDNFKFKEGIYITKDLYPVILNNLK